MIKFYKYETDTPSYILLDTEESAAIWWVNGEAKLSEQAWKEYEFQTKSDTLLGTFGNWEDCVRNIDSYIGDVK